MSGCSDSVKQAGASNPLQSKINPADYSSPAIGDNVLQSVSCDASVAIGDIVRLSGTTIIRAQADNFANSKAIGVCVAKSDPTTCDVQITGFTGSTMSGLTSETTYFLSDSSAGQLTSVPPTTSGSYVIKMGVAYTGTRLILQIERIVKRI